MPDDFDETKLFSQSAIRSQSLLEKYYRLPGLHILLPSKGVFLSHCNFEMDGTVAVYPMKAADDMILKNPDSLMSGGALENLFLSCVPGIPNPREISLPDIDVLLIAIRVATYGNKMKLDVTCPSCEEAYEYSCNLNDILSTLKYIEEEPTLYITPDLVATVRPYNLFNATKIAVTAFEQTRMLQNLPEISDGNKELSKVRVETMENAIAIVNEINDKTITDCIIEIQTPEGKVTNKGEIFKFISNTSKSWKEIIENKIKGMNEKGVDKTIKLNCPKCNHQWDSTLEIDPTNFFDAGS